MMIEAIVDAKYYLDNRYYEKVGSEVKDITDELPFEIPDNWVWIRLGYIVDFSQSDTVAASQINPSSWVLDLEDIEKDSGKLLQRKTFGETQSKSDKHCFFKGNVLYSKLRPYLNKVIVADADGYCTTEILAFNFGQHIAAQYAKTFFMSPYFVDYAMDGAYGVKMPRIGSHRGNSALMPVPPYTEQIHLVNRIDELFEQIDIIEQNQTDIGTLYDEFRKRTLTLAIQGKLVPQNPNDEPANVLLERIRAEKKAKLGKKYVDSYIYKSDDNCYYEKVGTNEPVRLDNLPFDIPDSWCWARLGNIGDWGAGATPARTNSQYYGGNIPWLKTGELNNDIIYGSEEHITDEALKECSLRYCRIGDVLIAMYGATIGKLAIAGVPLTTNQACCACTPYEGIYNFYLFYFLMEEKDNFTQMGFGGAQPNISKEKIIKHLFPVPPYEEQKEIVSTFISIQNILKDEN